MGQAFTKNYEDNSTDAGHQFTFYCDICRDGYRFCFIESSTYKKRKGSRLLGQGISFAGNLLGGRIGETSWNGERKGNMISERFDDKSPEWQHEHEQAFERAKNEGMQHFHECPSCGCYVCDHCFNKDEGMCIKCASRHVVCDTMEKTDSGGK